MQREIVVMNNQQNDPGSAATETLGLASVSVPHKVPRSVKHKPQDLLDHAVRQIKTQMIADQIYDRIRLGQSEQHLLLHTLQALNTDCVSTFLRQLSKRIEQGAK
jgi:hypothetical protein